MIQYAITAIGNRACGTAGWHVVGIGILTVGLWLGHPLWSLPLFAGCAVLFRSPSTRPWLHVLQRQKDAWELAMIRALWILPLLILETYFNPLSLLRLPLIAGIPLIYWLTGKQGKTEPVALAEFIVGGLL